MSDPAKATSVEDPAKATSVEAAADIAASIAPIARIALDARTLLAQVNAKIVALRRAIRHDHADAEYWEARETTAPRAQSDKALLRIVADLLHVERAHVRQRLHGTRFASPEEQRAWLESMLHRRCPNAARAAGLPTDATLARLRAGELVE